MIWAQVAGGFGQPGNGDSKQPQPYILIGESGKGVEQTARDLIGNLFMANFEIAGKYHPAADPDRYVIVVTNSNLLRIAREGGPFGGLLATVRIAINRKDKFTYITCQDPIYWGNAFLGDRYDDLEKYIKTFRRDLLSAMPRLRGKFNRNFGVPYNRPLREADIRSYHYRRRSAALNDALVLATAADHQEAVKLVEKALIRSPEISSVYRQEAPRAELTLFGFTSGSSATDSAILKLLENADMNYTASLPLEILVVGNRIITLPITYRLPLSAPAIDKRAFRKIRKMEARLITALEGAFQ